MMTALSEMGAVIVPPVPAFYANPQTLAEIIDQTASRERGARAAAGPRPANCSKRLRWRRMLRSSAEALPPRGSFQCVLTHQPGMRSCAGWGQKCPADETYPNCVNGLPYLRDKDSLPTDSVQFALTETRSSILNMTRLALSIAVLRGRPGRGLNRRPDPR